MNDPCFASATSVARAIRSGEASPVAVLEAYLDRIHERRDVTNAFVTLLEDEAREAAREAERAVDRGDDLGPLHGVPIAIKDLHTKKAGVRNTYGCAPLSDNVADRTAVVVDRLEAAGAVLVGTTNTPEFGHIPRTYNELIGPTGTPFAPDRTAGGSSGGSGAALGDGLVALATGSDTGGSIRVPAAYCGVVGIKPSYGLIPFDERPNFDTHTPFTTFGPLARTVEDAALMLEVMAGPDDSDPFALPPGAADRDFVGATERPAEDLSVGYSLDLDRFAIDPAVREAVGDAVDALGSAGATVEDVTVGGPDEGTLHYAYAKQGGVRFATLARTVREEFGIDLTGEHADQVSDSLVKTVGAGQGYDAVDYAHSQVPRTGLFDAVEAALDGHDALVCPTNAVPPFPIDEEAPQRIDDEPTSGTFLDWSLAWPFNLTGHPVVAVPAGLTDDGLPVGLQVVAGRHREDDAIAVAAAIERANPWHDDYPGVGGRPDRASG